MSKYIHNKSTAAVSLINGKILVKPGGKESVTDQEAEHEDVVHAKRAGWISIEGEESVTAAPTAPAGISFKEDEMKGSLTIPVVEVKETAVSSSIGSVEPEAEVVETSTKSKKNKKAE